METNPKTTPTTNNSSSNENNQKTEDAAYLAKKAKVEEAVRIALASQQQGTKRASSTKSRRPAPSLWIKLGLIYPTIGIIIVFYFLRIFEIISMLSAPLYAIMVLITLVAMTSLILFPPVLIGALLKRIGLIFLVLFSMKNDMDSRMANDVQRTPFDLRGRIAIVTGANSGIGFSTVKMLYQQGAHVIMTCRDMRKCGSAAEDIRSAKLAYPNYNRTVGQGQLSQYYLDMSDLHSIQAFAANISSAYPQIDYLVLNAGAVPPAGTITAQGLEASLGSMHFGNAALVHWLLPALTNPSQHAVDAALDAAFDPEAAYPPKPNPHSARIVIVGSEAYMMGAFHSSLFEGSGLGDMHGEYTDNCGSTGPFDMLACCPLMSCSGRLAREGQKDAVGGTNGYARSKLANVLYMQELQRRLDLEAMTAAKRVTSGDNGLLPRRVVLSTLHPGTVTSAIHPFLHSPITGLFIRTADSAAQIVMYALLSDAYAPASFIDAMRKPHDLFEHDTTIAENIRQHLRAFANEAYGLRRGNGLYQKWIRDVVGDQYQIPAVDAKDSSLLESPASLVAPIGVSFSFDQWFFRNRILPAICWNCANGLVLSQQAVASRLWDVTSAVIADFEANRPLFERTVTSSSYEDL